jgi:hypothetical protein
MASGANAASQAAQTASNIWNNSVNSSATGFGAANTFMNSMSNSPFTTLWGYNTGWTRPKG